MTLLKTAGVQLLPLAPAISTTGEHPAGLMWSLPWEVLPIYSRRGDTDGTRSTPGFHVTPIEE